VTSTGSGEHSETRAFWLYIIVWCLTMRNCMLVLYCVWFLVFYRSPPERMTLVIFSSTPGPPRKPTFATRSARHALFSCCRSDKVEKVRRLSPQTAGNCATHIFFGYPSPPTKNPLLPLEDVSLVGIDSLRRRWQRLVLENIEEYV